MKKHEAQRKPQSRQPTHLSDPIGEVVEDVSHDGVHPVLQQAADAPLARAAGERGGQQGFHNGDSNSDADVPTAPSAYSTFSIQFHQPTGTCYSARCNNTYGENSFHDRTEQNGSCRPSLANAASKRDSSHQLRLTDKPAEREYTSHCHLTTTGIHHHCQMSSLEIIIDMPSSSHRTKSLFSAPVPEYSVLMSSPWLAHTGYHVPAREIWGLGSTRDGFR